MKLAEEERKKVCISSISCPRYCLFIGGLILIHVFVSSLLQELADRKIKERKALAEEMAKRSPEEQRKWEEKERKKAEKKAQKRGLKSGKLVVS